MDEEAKNVWRGIGIGTMFWLAIWFMVSFSLHLSNNTGYKNKLVIKYHSPESKYDREMVMNLVEGSGIQTNFVDKSVKMDPWRMEWTLTNPTDNNHNN